MKIATFKVRHGRVMPSHGRLLRQESQETKYDFKPRELFKLIQTDKAFRDAALLGKYIFIDGKIALTSPECFSLYEGKVLFTVTSEVDYLLGKQVKVVTEYPVATIPHGRRSSHSSRSPKSSHSRSNAKYNIGRKRGENVTTQLIAVQPPLQLNTITAETISMLIGETSDGFASTVKKHMKQCNVTIEQLAEMANVSTKTIQRMRNDLEYRPTLRTIVAVCLALHLNPFDSHQLVNLAGYQLSDTNEQRTYNMLLNMFYLHSMDEIDTVLEWCGIPGFRSKE